MTTAHIPKTIEDAVSALSGIDRLLTAKDWERAAIVSAFTRDGVDGRPSAEKPASSGRLSPVEFAALGIVGLTSHTTVQRHRENWWNETQQTISPGDTVELPETPYPKDPSGRGFGDTSGRAPQTVAKQIEKVLQDRADVAQIVKEQMAVDPGVAQIVENNLTIEATAADTPFARKMQQAFVRKASTDEVLFAQVQDAYNEQHATPLPRASARGHTPMALGWASGVVMAIRRERDRGLEELLTYLRQCRENGDPQTASFVGEEAEALGRARDLLNETETEIREAGGVSVDAVFQRLMG